MGAMEAGMKLPWNGGYPTAHSGMVYFSGLEHLSRLCHVWEDPPRNEYHQQVKIPRKLSICMV